MTIAIVTKFSSIKKKKITSSTHPDISVNVSFFFSFQLFHPIINFSLNFIDRIFDDRNHYKIFLYQEKKNHNLTSSFIPVNASFSFSFQLFHRIVNFSLNFIDQSQSLQNFHLSRKKKITTSIYPLFHPRKRFFFFFFSIIPSYHKFFLKLYRSIEFSTIAIVIQIFLYQEKKKSQPRLYRSNFRRSLQNFSPSRRKKSQSRLTPISVNVSFSCSFQLFHRKFFLKLYKSIVIVTKFSSIKKEKNHNFDSLPPSSP